LVKEGFMMVRMQRVLGFALGWGLLVLVPSAGAAQQQAAPDVIVYASDLPGGALSEMNFWNDAASPGGKMIGIVNNGDELDPPPEEDPHGTFKVGVQSGVSYRCWIHMKVGAAKGKSQANLLWVQFSGAVDQQNQEAYTPGSASYLSAQGAA